MALLFFAALPASAADVSVIGVIGNKAAVVAIDGGEPKTIRIGQRWRGITVIAVDGDQATLEIDGKRRVLQRGVHYRSASSGAASGPGARQSVVLSPDSRGHFFAEGMINGVSMRFMVDTGATAVAIPASDATRLGIDYRKGRRIKLETANGDSVAFLVAFDRVQIGAIELHGIEGVVVEQGLPIALLGNSFLNRVEMRRDGNMMSLTRLF